MHHRDVVGQTAVGLGEFLGITYERIGELVGSEAPAVAREFQKARLPQAFVATAGMPFEQPVREEHDSTFRR